MVSLFSWLNEDENKFFAIHAVAIFILAVIVDVALPNYTIFALPAVLLLGVVSFMLNYPVAAIKEHGLFSEFLVELRLLWLIIVGVFSEYVVYQGLEQHSINLFGAVALLAGLVIFFYAHSSLHKKIVDARGFK